jgi:hypothetical protein
MGLPSSSTSLLSSQLFDIETINCEFIPADFLVGLFGVLDGIRPPQDNGFARLKFGHDFDTATMLLQDIFYRWHTTANPEILCR